MFLHLLYAPRTTSTSFTHRLCCCPFTVSLDSRGTELHIAIPEMNLLPSHFSAGLQWEFLSLYNLTPSCRPEPNASGVSTWPKRGQSPLSWSQSWYKESVHSLGSLLIRAERREHWNTMQTEERRRILWIPKSALVGSSQSLLLLRSTLREFKEASVTSYQKCLKRQVVTL